jgi:hypothetical protein
MTSSFVKCRICGARGTKFQVVESEHISKTLCNLNKEVLELKNELGNQEDLRDNLLYEIKMLANVTPEGDFVPTLKWLKYVRRSLKININNCNEQVTELQQVKHAYIIYCVTKGIPLSPYARPRKLMLLKFSS